MLDWDEMKYARLQNLLERTTCFGMKRPIGLDNGAFTIMAAYLLGVEDANLGLADENDLVGLAVEE